MDHVYMATYHEWVVYDFDHHELVAVSQSYRGAWEALYRYYLSKYTVKTVYGRVPGNMHMRTDERHVIDVIWFGRPYLDGQEFLIEKIAVLP